MSLMNRRTEYSWGQTSLTDLKLISESKEYKRDETVRVRLGYRVVGGLRESFIPDVWTVAWEDNDKLARLVMKSSLRTAGVPGKQARDDRKGGQEGQVLLEQGPGPPVQDMGGDNPRGRQRSHHTYERGGREIEVPRRREDLRDTRLIAGTRRGEATRKGRHQLGQTKLPREGQCLGEDPSHPYHDKLRTAVLHVFSTSFPKCSSFSILVCASAAALRAYSLSTTGLSLLCLNSSSTRKSSPLPPMKLP